MENNQKQPEKLRIQSSTYPEGWNPNDPRAFNAMWANAFSEAEKASRDRRHFQTTAVGAFSMN